MSANPAYQSSGLQSLALDENDIYEYEKSVGDAGGIADLGAIRERMEKLGRFGDDALAHVETGELIVPKPLLDKMPELKESILGHLRDMGVEDPERYIVGSGENAINPETGALEFFFKSVFRGIKKAVKSVGKVLKKVAPLAITVAGTALLGPAGLGLSTIAAGAISSGIGTLAGGGSIKDALFSAAIGGATGLIAPAVGDVAAGALGGMARGAVGGGDIEDILLSGAMGAGGAALGKIAGPSVNRMLGGKASTTTGLQDLQADLSRTGDFFDQTVSGQFEKAFNPSLEAIDAFAGTDFALKPFQQPLPVPEGFVPPLDLPGDVPQPVPSQNDLLVRVGGRTPVPVRQAFDTATVMDEFGNVVGSAPQTNQRVPLSPANDFDSGIEAARFTPTKDTPSILSRLQKGGQDVVDFVTQIDDPRLSQDEVLTIGAQAKKAALEKGLSTTVADDLSKKAMADAQPSFLARNRSLLIGGGIAGAAALPSLFEVPEMEEPDVIDKLTPAEREALVAANRLPPSALQAPITSPRQTRVATAPTSFGFNRSLRDRFPEMFAEDGGGVFPRRTGGIMPDEGIPGKDSVKAMVMPGEFIFTTKAVKGAGNGDLQQGINNMYSVMRNLEARGERMA